MTQIVTCLNNINKVNKPLLKPIKIHFHQLLISFFSLFLDKVSKREIPLLNFSTNNVSKHNARHTKLIPNKTYIFILLKNFLVIIT
jgi:hypothetical protein